MRVNTTLVLLCALTLSTLALAHGKGEHVMGTVVSTTEDTLVIKTTKGEEQTIQVDAKTRYEKSKQPAALKDLAPGERVVVDVERRNGKPVATLVRFGPPPDKSATKDSGHKDH